MSVNSIFYVFLLICLGCLPVYAQVNIVTSNDNGIEQLEKYLPLLRGKHIGMTVNHSSMIQGKRSLDVLLGKGVHVERLFSPEHGLYGAVSAATPVGYAVDGLTKIPIVSLFGEKEKPAVRDLRGIDLMLFDMQDVGARFYTYISTLHYIMESCAENNIPLLILDRPNPNDGYVDGPILDTAFRSFIGMHPVPIVHGMTIGEYAHMINGEGWLKNSITCDLKVIPVNNYWHGKRYKYELAPSPNLNTELSVYLYPSLCWFGATAISDGRGTFEPYLQLGHPAFKGQYEHVFIPQPIQGMNENPKLSGQFCYGPDLRNMPLQMFLEGGKLHLSWLLELYNSFPQKDLFFNGEKKAKKDEVLHFDLLAGSAVLRSQIHAGLDEFTIRKSWESGLKEFKKVRSKYLIYPDKPKQTWKFMSYNIHHGYNAEESPKLREMADLVETLSPDFLAIQEVDSVCLRSGGEDQARYIAEKNAMYYVFSKHFKLGEGSYGNAILSKYPITNVQEHRLPVSGKDDGVTFLTVDVAIEGQIIRIANVHMDYRAQESRIRQAHRIRDILKSSTHPFVLLGDFNAAPMSEELYVLSQDINVGNDLRYPTFPSSSPKGVIDYILFTDPLHLVQSYTYPSENSDHLPLVVELCF